MAEGLAQGDASIRAKAQNLAWEECVAEVRRLFFEQGSFAIRGPAWTELAVRQSDYVQLYVNVDSTDTPHTFDPALEPAQLGALDEDQLVLRLERLEHALSNSIFTYDEVLEAHRTGDRALLDRFAMDWNDVRDARPAFATFLREVQDEVGKPNWAELLRDRLGLAHYQPAGGAIPVALMSYSVGEVLAAAGATVAFTMPTVLDSTLWEHFFPAPKEISFGRAMALSLCDSDDMLIAEILHSRISYSGAHILKVGEIMNPLPILPVPELRERHLLALQLASGREDFGA